MSITFTQFLRPNGRQKKTSIDRPAQIENRAEDLKKAGYRLEIEELTTGQVHMTVSDPEEGIDIVRRICSNGPAVPRNVDSMILEAHGKLIEEGEKT